LSQRFLLLLSRLVHIFPTQLAVCKLFMRFCHI